MDFRLPKTAFNAAVGLILGAGLNPAEFRRSEEDRKSAYQQNVRSTRITHVPTGYSFLFSGDQLTADPYFLAEWTPPHESGKYSASADTRDTVLAYFKAWLSYVREEHEAPDIWAEFEKESELIVGEVVDEEDRQFAPAERELLLLRLNEIRDYLIERAASNPQQVTFIDATINYLAESSERLTKRDWKNIFVNGLVTLAVALGTNPDVVRGAFALATKYIMPLLGKLSLPALLP
jgi:hypothetical protein